MSDLENSICKQGLFDSFFTKNAKGLRDFLFYKFGDMTLAEDLVQEAFVKLWENCATTPLSKAKSFAYTVAVNLGNSAMRHEQVKFKYKDYILQREDDITEESPEFLVLEKEYMERFNSSLAKLSDRQREVFLLNRIEKKTYKEIAEVSGVSVKAVEKLMHKALLKLRESIGDI